MREEITRCSQIVAGFVVIGILLLPLHINGSFVFAQGAGLATSSTRVEVSQKSTQAKEKKPNASFQSVEIGGEATTSRGGGGSTTRPELELRQEFVVVVGESKDMTPRYLSFSQGAVYTLQTVPLHGDVYLDNKQLVAGDTFRENDIARGKVAYTARQQGPSDSFYFSVAAGATALGEQMFPITIVEHRSRGQQALPAITGNVSGYTPGSASVDLFGQLNYAIELAVPPGTGGIQPELSLVYNSGGGAGHMGRGWNIGGVSVVSRCSETIAHDGFRGAVDFDTTDRWCLDGGRLVAVAGNYGSDGTEYRLEHDPTTQVFSHGALISDTGELLGPEYFIARTAAGLTYAYGQNTQANSRVYHTPSSAPVAWSVDRIQDTVGNYMTFGYVSSPTTGEHRISRIDYTGNQDVRPVLARYATVRFAYEQRPAQDQRSGYYRGQNIVRNNRLSSITMYVNKGDGNPTEHAHNIARQYRLGYEESDTIGESLLGSVQECGRDNECLRPTTFTWESREHDQRLSPLSLPGHISPSGGPLPYTGFAPKVIGDINGDGRTDMVMFTINDSSGRIESSFDIHPSFTYLGRPDGAFDQVAFQGPSLTLPQVVAQGDFNADGLHDFILVEVDESGRFPLRIVNSSRDKHEWLHVMYSQGDGTFLPDIVRLDGIPGVGLGSIVGTGDFNGDGRTDVLAARTNDDGNINPGEDIIVNFMTPTGDFRGESMGAISSHAAQVRVVDIDNDGKSDVIGWSANSSRTILRADAEVRVYITDNNGIPGVIDQAIWVPADDKSTVQSFTDANGDGLADVVIAATWRNGSIQAGASSWVYLSHGDGTFHRVGHPLVHTQELEDYQFVFSGDVDGDGYGDLVSIGSDKHGRIQTRVGMNVNMPFTPSFTESDHHEWAVHYSQGDGTYRTERVAYAQRNDPRVFGAVDFDGDGVQELLVARADDKGVMVGADYWPEVFQFTKSSPERITEITNGHGYRIHATYTQMSHEEDVSRDNALGLYPRATGIAPTDVVSRLGSSDGIGGMRDVTYQYHDFLVDQEGRGAYGFHRVVRHDEEKDITMTSIHDTHPHRKGLVVEQETVLGSGVTIGHTTTQWETRTMMPGAYISFDRETRTASYDAHGTYIKSEITTKKVDDFGHPTEIHQELFDVGDAFGSTVTTHNTYDNKVGQWHLGRLVEAAVTYAYVPTATRVADTQTQRSHFSYDAHTGLLASETTHPGTRLELTKTYTRDGFGNIIRSTTDGPSISARSTTTRYDTRGRFVAASVNDLGHTDTFERESLWGAITAQTGPNGRTTELLYDPFGRMIQTTSSSGALAGVAYRMCSTGCPQGAVYKVHKLQQGIAPTVTYFDILGRPIQTKGRAHDGRIVYTKTMYNSDGAILQNSLPYYAGENPEWTRYEYDVLGRVVHTEFPNGSYQENTYTGNRSTSRRVYTEPGSLQEKELTSSHVVNMRGEITESIDHEGSRVSHTYDSKGRLITTRGADGSETHFTYDQAGNRVSITEPNAGTVTSWHDALGQEIRTMDARGEVVHNTYDTLGRRTQSVASDGTLRTWVFDTKQKGSLSHTSTQGYRHELFYDGQGRVRQETHTLDTEPYAYEYTYDRFDRIKTIAYPGDVRVRNIYNHRGDLAEVKDTTTGDVVWRLFETNARGQVTKELLGNGLVTEYEHDPYQNLVTAITTGTSGNADSIQDVSFEYNTLGNMVARHDGRHGLSESFQYDTLGRLVVAQQRSGDRVEVAYDDVGNIIEKTGVGSYTYGAGGVGPHAVTSVSGTNGTMEFSYDASGNRIASVGNHALLASMTIEYSALGKPVHITDGASETSFAYGSDGSRYRYTQTDGSNNATTYYAGSRFETFDNGAERYARSFIHGRDRAVAFVKETTDGAEFNYLHHDHLGSVVAATDESQAIVFEQSFDAWGASRDPETWEPLVPTTDQDFEYGFTGHQTLADLGLVHMGGRIYDPVLSRFISPDPFVQSLAHTQSLNRYSYAFNNPLTVTDPSGYISIGDIVKIAVVVVAVAVGSLAVVAAIKGTTLAGAMAAIKAGTVSLSTMSVAGAYGGFMGSFMGTVMNTGDIRAGVRAGVRGGVAGGLQAGLANIIGNTLGHTTDMLHGNWAGKVVAHGSASGLATMVAGGKFEHGLTSGAFVAGLAPVSNGAAQMAGGGIGAQALVAAAVGGSASAIGGGKFANGAVSGGFIQLFNESFSGGIGGSGVAPGDDEGRGLGGTGYSLEGALDAVQAGLAVAGMTPVVGNVADILDGVISALRGDWVGTGIAAAAAVPAAGIAVRGSEALSKVDKAIDTVENADSFVPLSAQAHAQIEDALWEGYSTAIELAEELLAMAKGLPGRPGHTSSDFGKTQRDIRYIKGKLVERVEYLNGLLK